MAPAKGKRKSKGKRKAAGRKKIRAGSPGDMIVYKGIGIPDCFYTKLKYVEVRTITAGVGASYQTYQFRGNSCYDPNYTGTGSQPMEFDQICGASALYTQYIVNASKIKARISATGDTFAVGNAEVAITPKQDLVSTAGWTSIDDQLATKGTKSACVTRYDNGGVKFINNYASSKRVLDIKDMNDNLANCSGTYAANPSASWYWILGMQGMDRTSTSASVNVRVEITYYVKFFNNVDPAQS